MSTATQAGIADVLSKGVQGFVQGTMDRDKVAVAKAKSEQELSKLKYQEQTGSVQQQIDVQNQKLRTQEAQLDKAETFRTLRLYQSDSNTRHLNRMFKDNPRIAEGLGVTEVMPLDPYNSEDVKMIIDSGGDPSQFMEAGVMEGSEDSQIVKNTRGRYIKSRLANGEWKVTDMQNVYAGTGFTKQLADEELAQLMAKSKVEKATRGKGESMMSRKAGEAARAQARIDSGEGTAKDREVIKFANKEKAGVKPGQVDIAEETTVQLVDSFGGEDSFFETDFSDRGNFTKAWPKVHKIMRVGGTDFSTKDRAEIHGIRSLLALGEPGSNLSAEETGLLDNMLSNVSKYLTDEVGGIEAKSAYAAFRNTVRHALYGAALTQAEITSFNEAFGTLGQKLGPVLQQFKTSLQQVKAKLDSIADLNDPYVSKVLLGSDQVQMDEMLVALEERIAYVEGKGPNKQRKSIKDRLQEKLRTEGVIK